MTTVAFQRARKPAERIQRRDAILSAAAEIVDLDGPAAATLNAIAGRAGFTKSNIYRYFESREEVLLSLLLEAYEEFVHRLEIQIAICPPKSTLSLSHTIAEAFLERPRLAALLAIVATEIEANVSVETMMILKRDVGQFVTRIAFAIHDKLDGTSLDDCTWAAALFGPLMAGLWPAAHPSPVAVGVLSMPEFMHLRTDLARDLQRAVRALLDNVVDRPSNLV